MLLFASYEVFALAMAAPSPDATKADIEAIDSRTNFLRLSLVLSLLASAVICGVVAYRHTDRLEAKLGIQMYESIAATVLKEARSNTLRKAQGADAMASIMRNAFPDASQWPFIALDGYAETASKIAEVSSATAITLIPFVQPEQALEWEKEAVLPAGTRHRTTASDNIHVM